MHTHIHNFNYCFPTFYSFFGHEELLIQGISSLLNYNNCLLVSLLASRPSQIPSFFFFFLFFCLFRAVSRAYGSSRLEVESELQLLAYATATATQDLSCNCNLHHSSQQRWILNPMSEARDQTSVLIDTSRVCYHWAMTGTPHLILYRSETYLWDIWICWSQTYSFSSAYNDRIEKQSLWNHRDLCLNPAPFPMTLWFSSPLSIRLFSNKKE